jgi:hypothetical protein
VRNLNYGSWGLMWDTHRSRKLDSGQGGLACFSVRGRGFGQALWRGFALCLIFIPSAWLGSGCCLCMLMLALCLCFCRLWAWDFNFKTAVVIQWLQARARARGLCACAVLCFCSFCEHKANSKQRQHARTAHGPRSSATKPTAHGLWSVVVVHSGNLFVFVRFLFPLNLFAVPGLRSKEACVCVHVSVLAMMHDSRPVKCQVKTQEQEGRWGGMCDMRVFFRCLVCVNMRNHKSPDRTSESSEALE